MSDNGRVPRLRLEPAPPARPRRRWPSVPAVELWATVAACVLVAALSWLIATTG